ncbi:MAG: beta-lactamase family protein [Acetobacteraceae bacterium]|nr:beta-lactamase family protein [Acetobacteraceae bacterium]
MTDTAAIDRILQAAVTSGSVPGVVAAARNANGVIYQGAFGRHGVASDAPVPMDAVFRIASMTKAITATAAMQLVEQGKLSLDRPAGEILPQLASPQVLEGFDAAGKPRLRPAKGVITLRKLLTHTAGFVYDTWNAGMNRYAQLTGLPAARSGKLAALNAPLGFDPGQRWEYGINIDFAGRMVEAVSGQTLEAYMQRHILAPLGMRDTTYLLRPGLSSRLVHITARTATGALEPFEVPAPAEPPEFFPGGGGLFSTAPDYMAFLGMLLGGGSLNGAHVLRPETVATMAQNQMGDLNVLPLKSSNPILSNDVDLFPDVPKKWGLSFLINTRDLPTGRSAGSLAWAGLYNTYFWLDPKRRIAGVLMTQILPFVDKPVLRLLDEFESAVYTA